MSSKASATLTLLLNLLVSIADAKVTQVAIVSPWVTLALP
jgi:hypothetical protein